tara:strand:- start:31 stop:375 length:345 start_codon:yes stop_codon:yes gene_type:complete
MMHLGKRAAIMSFMGCNGHSKHILLVDGLFEWKGADGSVDDHWDPDGVPPARCLCGIETSPQEKEAVWISLIPTDEDYIIGITRWLEENAPSDMCKECVEKVTRMEQMVALGGR